MTPQEGKRWIQRILGPRAAWQDTGRPTSPEQREQAQLEWAKASAALKAARAAQEARREEVLAADETYQRLKAETRAALDREQKVGGTGGYRISVGRDLGFAFEIAVQGDNWSDVVKKLKAKERSQSAPVD